MVRALRPRTSVVLPSYAVVALVVLAVLGTGALATALYQPSKLPLLSADAWCRYRFGFATYALIFIAFDMEMIFMYPWAVVFAEIGLEAFLDMFVFIALLGGGIAYAWGMGGLKWE